MNNPNQPGKGKGKQPGWDQQPQYDQQGGQQQPQYGQQGGPQYGQQGGPQGGPQYGQQSGQQQFQGGPLQLPPGTYQSPPSHAQQQWPYPNAPGHSYYYLQPSSQGVYGYDYSAAFPPIQGPPSQQPPIRTPAPNVQPRSGAFPAMQWPLPRQPPIGIPAPQGELNFRAGGPPCKVILGNINSEWDPRSLVGFLSVELRVEPFADWVDFDESEPGAKENRDKHKVERFWAIFPSRAQAQQAIDKLGEFENWNQKHLKGQKITARIDEKWNVESMSHKEAEKYNPETKKVEKYEPWYNSTKKGYEFRGTWKDLLHYGPVDIPIM